MPKIARLNDTSDHGGTIISASSSLLINGVGAARVGDMHSCPITGHGTTPIVSAPGSSVTNEGMTVATVGSVTGCGAVINSGSDDTEAYNG